MRWLETFADSMDMNLKDRGAWHAAVHGAANNSNKLAFFFLTPFSLLSSKPCLLLYKLPQKMKLGCLSVFFHTIILHIQPSSNPLSDLLPK